MRDGSHNLAKDSDATGDDRAASVATRQRPDVGWGKYPLAGSPLLRTFVRTRFHKAFKLDGDFQTAATSGSRVTRGLPKDAVRICFTMY